MADMNPPPRKRFIGDAGWYSPDEERPGLTPTEAAGLPTRRVSRVEWNGHEVTLYFDRSSEPFSEREFVEGSHTRRMFAALEEAIGGIVKAYEAAEEHDSR